MTTTIDKANLLGVLVNKTDYARVVADVIRAAKAQQPLSVSALAVHGVMCGMRDEEQKYRLNHIDIVAPDGQPVRWALNLLYGAQLQDRVYGPDLMLHVCAEAEREDLPVFLYGTNTDTLQKLIANLREKFSQLRIVGAMPSRFGKLKESDKADLATAIRSSGARIVFVGLGCPRQEVWVYEFRDVLEMPVLAVGAAFAFHANVLPQAPRWMQRAGLEWLFRLAAEPRRLWRRYVFLNPAYLFLIACQAAHLKRFRLDGTPPKHELLYG